MTLPATNVMVRTEPVGRPRRTRRGVDSQSGGSSSSSRRAPAPDAPRLFREPASGTSLRFFRRSSSRRCRSSLRRPPRSPPAELRIALVLGRCSRSSTRACSPRRGSLRGAVFVVIAIGMSASSRSSSPRALGGRGVPPARHGARASRRASTRSRRGGSGRAGRGRSWRARLRRGGSRDHGSSVRRRGAARGHAGRSERPRRFHYPLFVGAAKPFFEGDVRRALLVLFVAALRFVLRRPLAVSSGRRLRALPLALGFRCRRGARRWRSRSRWRGSSSAAFPRSTASRRSSRGAPSALLRDFLVASALLEANLFARARFRRPCSPASPRARRARAPGPEEEGRLDAPGVRPARGVRAPREVRDGPPLADAARDAPRAPAGRARAGPLGEDRPRDGSGRRPLRLHRRARGRSGSRRGTSRGTATRAASSRRW